MAARLVAVLAGVWLMASPAVFGYVGTTAATTGRIAGPVAAALSFVAIWGIARALRWTTLPIGLFCVLVPWFLDFPNDAALSTLAVGLVLVVTAFIRGEVTERYGGGWVSLREARPGLGRRS